MQVEQLQLVHRSQTSKIIFNFLSSVNPNSNETNVETFKSFLKTRGHKIIDADYYKVFDDLEEAEVGYYSKTHADRFVWNYNLRDISEQILNPNKKVEIRQELRGPNMADKQMAMFDNVQKIGTKKEKVEVVVDQKRKPGRPKGAKNRTRRPKLIDSKPIISNRLVFVYTTKFGNLVLLTLDDVDSIMKQADQIKSQISVELVAS